MAVTLRQESSPGDPVLRYAVIVDGERLGSVFRTGEGTQWGTDPDLGTYENRESAVHAVATGRG